MKRREFCKGIALVPASGAMLSISPLASSAPAEKASASSASSPPQGSGSSGTGAVPEFAEHMLTTDMNGLGPDGKPTGKTATFTGASRARATTESAGSKMKLTAEEQAVLDGKEGPEKAKLMKIMVMFGETFGATKMVDLGGAPHSNLFIGAPYMESLIDMLDECAQAGLKSYATYTVNPRPYDVYNVQNNPKDMEMIYQGYPLQMRLDYVHSKLGAPDLNYRSCACYIDDVGNAPEPGTYVAWCESSAVNYGNSVLGIRTNRYGAGMEMICAMLGKAPLFGLMTDEGRQAKWLIDVRTSYVAGADQYFEGGEVTNDNWHKLKYMGSATAAAGAVGLYHVEGVTPEPKEKGRKLLVKGYKTYVYDDSEQQRIIDTFENLWPDQNADPTAAFIGCPHCNYEESVRWARMITDALDKAGQEKTAIPVYIFMPTVVRTRILMEEPELAAKAKAAGVSYTNMCAVVYSGMKGFSERVRGVTNSAKNRNYSSIRYFPDQKLVDIMLTGKV
jgi:hypothetical protein